MSEQTAQGQTVPLEPDVGPDDLTFFRGLLAVSPPGSAMRDEYMLRLACAENGHASDCRPHRDGLLPDHLWCPDCDWRFKTPNAN